MMKLALAALLFAAAGIAISYPYWKPDGIVKQEGAEAKLAADDEAEFHRQERDRALVLQRGGVTGTE
ncbi:MAG: hypothetical protein ACF8R7_01225 [Phycisphaerales bacterium JB039]